MMAANFGHTNVVGMQPHILSVLIVSCTVFSCLYVYICIISAYVHVNVVRTYECTCVHTVYTLIFAGCIFCGFCLLLIFTWFNIRGIRRLEAIRESLDPQKFRSGSCVMVKHGHPRTLKRENR